MNKQSLQQFADRTNLYHSARALFETDLAIPLKRVTELPVPINDLLGDNYRDNLHKTINKAYFAGIVDDEAFSAADTDTAPESEPPETAARAAREQTDRENYDGLVIFALDLKPRPNDLAPTRSDLAAITRSFNRSFHGHPVAVLFRYKAEGSDYISLATCERTPYKQMWREGEKPGKVSLLRDIRIDDPHAGHLRILNNLKIPRTGKKAIQTFEGLYQYWQKVLDAKLLNEEFYRELSNWYFWAQRHVEFPEGAGKDKDIRNATSVIRLITRVLFVWFLQEKKLIPEDLFDKQHIDSLLHPDSEESAYYKAILQNLFFATLNREMGKREFRKEGQHYNITNLYRYKNLMHNSDALMKLFESIPFLNGGLFECLDRPDPNKKGPKGGEVIIRVDGFSDRKDNPIRVPDMLFWGEEQKVDLSEEYGQKKRKSEKVRGLIPLLKAYKFTITENTPLEQDVALDPELLGKVFENLLASYNPETKTTARKGTGSYYTPREIVDYMVDESLIACLAENLTTAGAAQEQTEKKLRQLFAYTDEPHQFSDGEVDKLIDAIENIRILDPACGSGAFPMGVLHRLVHILTKLDPDNEKWLQRQLNAIQDTLVKEEVEQSVRENYDNYGRKLFLIENCIYGVDIQPVAVQIAKLRFFISLVVDQCPKPERANRGIRALPNLETKFVAANTLVGLDRPKQMLLRNPEIDRLEKELADVRHRHFNAKTPSTKRKYREKDRELREQIGELLEGDGWLPATAHQVAAWDPYDQNASAPFFDLEWMFGIDDGFDVVIGNPPYVQIQKLPEKIKALLGQQGFSTYARTSDLYALFYELGGRLLNDAGHLFYISSNKFMRAGYGKSLREFLSQKNELLHLVDFGELPVFEAGTDPCIVLYKNTAPTQSNSAVTVAAARTAKDIADIPGLVKNSGFRYSQDELPAEGWTLEGPEIIALLHKLKKKGTPLGEFVQGKFYRGVLTGLNEAFVIDRETHDRLVKEDPKSAELIKPWLRGKDIKRWHADWQELYLINIVSSANVEWPWSKAADTETAENIFAATYPALHKHLSSWRQRLISRDDQGRFFWELRSCVYHEVFSNPKIVYNETSKELHAFLDENGLIINKTGFIILGDHLPHILGILNSKALDWLYRHEFPSWGNPWEGGRIQFRGDRMRKVMIPPACEAKRYSIEVLVNRIQSARQSDPSADVSKLEAELDRLVYALYGLTDDEIAIVENQE